MIYRDFIKRGLDVLVAFVLFSISLPLFIIISILLSIYNQGTPFFVQSRPGLKAVSFNLIKFKTMSDLKDDQGNLLPDEIRLTGFGAFIRKTSLDEIPQLLNVIKGDMSIVGPRPLLTEYLSLYNEEQKRRHEVRPGITGWAQVNGRNAIGWREKFEFDVWYVDHQGFALDLLILWKTLRKVISGEGVSAENHVTIEKFRGN